MIGNEAADISRDLSQKRPRHAGEAGAEDLEENQKRNRKNKPKQEQQQHQQVKGHNHNNSGYGALKQEHKPKSSQLNASVASTSSSSTSATTPRPDAAPASRLHDGYVAVQKARSLFYISAKPNSKKDRVETRLASRISQLSSLLKQIRSTTPRQINEKFVAESGALLSAISGGSEFVACRATLRLAALLDDLYMELFISDQSSRGGSVPEPHFYIESLVMHTSHATSSLTPCSECGKASTPSSLLCKACSIQNPQLAYLRLRSLEASPKYLDLIRLTKAALKIDGVTFGPPSGTMRVAEPLGCETLRLWQAASRERVCHWSAFACPDANAAAALRQFSAGAAIHEVGAGTGYWAAYLQKLGLKVSPSDTRPVDDKSRMANEYHGRLKPWCTVKTAEANASAEIAGSSGGLLFMCYPPPTEMGLNALRAYERAGGLLFAMAGEIGGDTGSISLESHLNSRWLMVQSPFPLPAYGDTAACLTLWRRKAVPEKKEGGASSSESRKNDEKQGKIAVYIEVSGGIGEPLKVMIKSGGGSGKGASGEEFRGSAETKTAIAAAKSRPTSSDEISKAVGSLGDTPFSYSSSSDLSISVRDGGAEGGFFIPLSEVKETRRLAVQAFMTAVSSSRSSFSLGGIKGPLYCAGCGKCPSTGGSLLRDRLTRTICCCNNGDLCALSPAVRSAIDTQLAIRCLPALEVFEGMGKSIPGGLFTKVVV